jgi:hypothetical protein
VVSRGLCGIQGMLNLVKVTWIFKFKFHSEHFKAPVFLDICIIKKKSRNGKMKTLKLHNFGLPQ